MDYPDIINYSRDELLEEYCKLFDRHQDLRESSEADTQKIYELKRALDTAVSAQCYLTQELEQYTNNDSNSNESELQRTQANLVELKKKYGKLEMSFAALQQDYNGLMEENTSISQNLEEALKRSKENIPVLTENKISEEDLLRIQMLENENMDLLQKMEDFEDSAVRYTLTIAECEKNIEILQDEITCLKENLHSKRMDLEEKVQILESTQEQLAEANAKIAMLSAAPENNDRKGNSLFAEVDDQRQAMKQKLTAQNKRYLEMKKIYDESEHEIRLLKRKNISMHTELEACSSIFCKADKIYQEKLNDRVHQLMNQNEELDRQLCWTQERLIELSREKKVLWLDSMLSFCKNETDDLKKQINRSCIQNANLEEDLRNAQQDMARWRFEALKLRCVLLDREDLLTQNKISFKPVTAMEFCLSEKEQKEARPRIVSKRRSSTFDNIVARQSMTPKKEVMSANEIMSKTENQIVNVSTENFKNDKIEENAIDCDDKKEIVGNDDNEKENFETKEHVEQSVSTAESHENSVIVCTSAESSFPVCIDLTKQNIMLDKENCSNTDVSYLTDNFAKLKATSLSPMRKSQRSSKKTPCTITSPSRSILIKERDTITKEPCKNVKFSSKDDIVHNLSSNTTSPSSPTNNKKVDITSTGKENSKTFVTKTRTKSNIVVRRVVVSSKHD